MDQSEVIVNRSVEYILGLRGGNLTGAEAFSIIGVCLAHLLARAVNIARKENIMPKVTVCLWFDKDAEEAARFYAKTFPNSAVGAVIPAPGDYPSGKKGDTLLVEFTVLGLPCIGLNGGPMFKHNEAFSFQVSTEDQAETDRYWSAIVNNGGEESACGWCKDKWGVNWQITPKVLLDAISAGGEKAKRAFAAMMPMQKIDVATIKRAINAK